MNDPFAARYVASDIYEARHDAGIIERVIEDLLSHWGQWRRITSVYHLSPTMARDIVEVGRRWGLVIEGRRGRQGGYRVVAWRRPPLWTHLAALDDIFAAMVARYCEKATSRPQQAADTLRKLSEPDEG